jgi:glyoxylase-like metal-dependent hydrolase (beta-lactamase superfamily II)
LRERFTGCLCLRCLGELAEDNRRMSPKTLTLTPPGDRHLLSNPMAAMSPETAGMLLGGKYVFAEPDDVAELADLQTLTLAGIDFVVDHTPGHTEGSVTFRTLR